MINVRFKIKTPKKMISKNGNISKKHGKIKLNMLMEKKYM